MLLYQKQFYQESAISPLYIQQPLQPPRRPTGVADRDGTFTNSFSQAEFAHEYPKCIPINYPGVSVHAFIVKGRGCTVFECSKVQVCI